MTKPGGSLPYEFSCSCGTRIRVDPMTKERRILCPRCRKPVDFTVNFDTTRRTLQVSAVVPRNPPAVPATAPPESARPQATVPGGKAAGRTVRAVMALCSCGKKFPIDERRSEGLQSCPGCNCAYHVVLKTEGKKQVAILVPEKPIVHRDEIIRTTIYRKVPEAAGKTAPVGASPSAESGILDGLPPLELVSSRRSRSRTVVPKPPPPVVPVRPKPAPEVPPGAQAVPCSCGETFIVRKKDLSPGLTCRGCGIHAVFEELRDPQTLAPKIRIKAPPHTGP